MKRRLIDPVRVQFSVSIRQKRGTKIPQEVLEHAIRRWMMEEKLPRGFRVNAVVWQNPERNNHRLRDWRAAGDRRAIARLLRGKPYTFVDPDAESARDSLRALALAASISIKVGNS